MSAKKSRSASTPASAVVVAAGLSARMNSKIRKPYLKLRGKPILSWTLEALARISGLIEIVLVIRPEDKVRAAKIVRTAQLPDRLKIHFADGGPRRQDSVYNGLLATNAQVELVYIHDAARPFPAAEAMAQAGAAALKYGGAILAIPMRDTVKRHRANATDHIPAQIASTVDRSDLWLAQTPQVFRRKLILESFERLNAQMPTEEVTDDASIFERFGRTVVLIESSMTNFKVTRPEDIALAEACLSAGIVI